MTAPESFLDLYGITSAHKPRTNGHAKDSGRRSIAADSWPQLDEAALYGLAGDVVNTISPHSEADPVAILLQFLAAFGNVIGRGPYYQVEGDKHATNLYVVLVGDTSKGRKGTSWGRVRQIFEAVDSQWLNACVHGGLSSGEGLIWAVHDAIIKRRKTKENVIQDEEEDPGVSDKRLMIIEPEFASVLRVMHREGNSLSRVFRDAWDRGDLATMTKNSPARATGALVSIVGHVTADELREHLDRIDIASGTANRLLLACVRRSQALPFGGNLDDAVLKELGAEIYGAVQRAHGIKRVTLTSAARDEWERIYEDLSEPQPGLLGAITARAEAQVIRLALLYALLDKSDMIDVVHLRAARALWDYCEASARRIFGETLGDPLADQVERSLRDAGEPGLSRTKISKILGRNRPASEIDRVLSKLERCGRASRTERQTGGRPEEVWCVRR